jgi:hypothetical protein
MGARFLEAADEGSTTEFIKGGAGANQSHPPSQAAKGNQPKSGSK